MIERFASSVLRKAALLGPIVLTYHSISSGSCRPQSRWSVRLENFKRQIDLLQRSGWAPITARQLLRMDDVPRNSVVISFDDGYKDNLPAYEYLRSKGVPATWFVVADAIGGGAIWQADADVPAAEMFSWQDLMQMDGAGMEVASHGCAHVRLDQLGERELVDNLSRSKTILEDKLGAPVQSLAYPYGVYDEGVKRAAEQVGYGLGFSCHSGWVRTAFDPYAVRRIAVYHDDSLLDFAYKVAFADNQVRVGKVAGYYLRRVVGRFPFADSDRHD